MKTEYNIFQAILDNSGFGMNAAGIPTAPDDVWDDYIKAHPKSRKYKTARLEFYDELHSIIGIKHEKLPNSIVNTRWFKIHW